MTITFSLIELLIVVSWASLGVAVYGLWNKRNAVAIEEVVDKKAKPITDFLDEYNEMIKDARNKTMEQLSLLGGSYKSNNGNGEDIN